MKLKNILLTGLSLALVAAMAVGGTLAYLTQDVGKESNVFSVGNVNISLDEEVGVLGEGGEVKQTEDGAEYIEVLPGDYLKKKVTVTNNGKTDAYVAVTVTMNNADEINSAIDDVYGDGAAGGQAMYDFIFDGWGINQDPRPGALGVNDARGVIDGTYGLPEHVLKVDFAKTVKGSTVIGANNWFVAGSEKSGQYWVDGPKAYDGYYTADMNDYEICYTYYMLLPAGESTTLFKGLNVPAAFNNDQMAMFDGLEINVEAAAIQADNMAVAAQFAKDVNGKAKTAFAILAGDIETPDYSNKPAGKNAVGYTFANSVWGESTGNAKESFEIKIYSGDTYMGYASLNNINNIIDGDVTVTWTLYLDNSKNGTTDSYWNKSWVVAPSIDVQPTTVELWIDGEKVAEGGVQLNGPDNVNKIGGAVVDANGKILRYVVKGTDANVQAGETYMAFVSSTEEMNTALSEGATDLYLMPGEYTVDPTTRAGNLTISGTKDAVLVHENEGEDGCDYGFDGATVTFNGITIDTTESSGNYRGYARMTATYNDCNIIGTYTTNGTDVFNNCTFNTKNGYIWTWGAPSVTFDACTFDNIQGKAILAHGWSTSTITVKDCTFKATEKGYTGSGDWCAVVEIDPAGTNTYTINFKGTNVVEETYNGYYRVKNAGEAGQTTVNIEG